MNVPFHHRFLSRSCRGTALSRAHPRERCARLTDLKVGHHKTLAPVGAAFLGGRLSSVLPRLKGGGMTGGGVGDYDAAVVRVGFANECRRWRAAENSASTVPIIQNLEVS
jgi:hypothetical protein